MEEACKGNSSEVHTIKNGEKKGNIGEHLHWIFTITRGLLVTDVSVIMQKMEEFLAFSIPQLCTAQ